jgi:hypothetical protein
MSLNPEEIESMRVPARYDKEMEDRLALKRHYDNRVKEWRSRTARR